MRIDVGIGDFAVSSDAADTIKTYALGSCVAVVAYDKARKVAGLIHIALPESSVNPGKGAAKPGYFADTGLPLFLDELKKKGASRQTTSFRIAGGSTMMDAQKTFDIGRRNVIAVKRYLWKNGLGVVREDVGGEISRTVSVEVKSGEMLISNKNDSWTI